VRGSEPESQRSDIFQVGAHARLQAREHRHVPRHALARVDKGQNKVSSLAAWQVHARHAQHADNVQEPEYAAADRFSACVDDAVHHIAQRRRVKHRKLHIGDGHRRCARVRHLDHAPRVLALQ
jgi:hypothetical protein